MVAELAKRESGKGNDRPSFMCTTSEMMGKRLLDREGCFFIYSFAFW